MFLTNPPGLERKVSTEKSEKDDSTGPEVCLVTVAFTVVFLIHPGPANKSLII